MDDIPREAIAQAVLRKKNPASGAAAMVRFLDRYALAILALLLLVAIPAFAGTFRLGLFGKYLSFAFCAVGLVLAWGYGGILSWGKEFSSDSAVTFWRCS
jgi:urea transport system permease protein